MSKRFYVTLPDLVADALDRWASNEGTKPATLAGFHLEQEIRSAMKDGRIPPPPDTDTPTKAEPHPETNTLMQSYLKLLASGSSIPDEIIQLLAQETELTEEELRGIRDRLTPPKP